MRNAYVTIIGGTLIFAAVLGGVAMFVLPSSPVSPVSASDAAIAASGSASEQAAALEAAESEARDNPPEPSTAGVVQAPPEPNQPSAAPSGYQGSTPTPSIQFSDGAGQQQANGDEPPPEPVVTEE